MSTVYKADDDGNITVYPPIRRRRADDTTEELVLPDLSKEFCSKCWLNRKRVDYGFANRKVEWVCPKCGEGVEEQ